MFDKWLKLPAHYYLKIIALVLLTIGVCLHNTLMSIGTIWIAANWLIEAKYPAYWTKFKGTPAIWFLLAILAYSFLSLTWSDDVAFGLKDIGKKMPFFVIPFVLGLSKPLEQKVRDFLFYLFLVILVLASFINFYRFNYVLEAGHDIREMSYFISHVRFSILTVLGIAVGFHLISKQIRRGFVLVPVILWLLYYTYKSQIINGYVLLITLLFMSALFALMKLKSRPLKFSGLTLLVIAASGFVYKVSETLDSFEEPAEVNISELPKYTESGNLYMHDLKSKLRENGNLLWYYLQPIELENEWNKRSTIDYRAKDQKNQPMFGTLIRYMTSRDLTKDSAGVAQLSDKEVVAIENGSTSIRINDGLSAKVDEFMYQWFAYKNEGNPNGNSLLQRLEHLNVGWSIAAKNLFFGVGIGDVHASFLKEYELLDSQLLAENQHRAHNQYLTYWISLGILGLLIFLAFLCSPMRYTKEKDYIFYAIFLVLTISLFFQDLLETQAGVCIFGLFYGLMAFTAPANPEEHPSLLGSDQ
jgi:hypothetical protein